MHEKQPLNALPRWLSPRAIALGALLLGATALSLVRVDWEPGAAATAVMLGVAWAPMALRARRPWVRRLRIGWTSTVTLLHLGWWTDRDLFWRLPASLREGYAYDLINPWDGWPISGRSVEWAILRLSLGLCLAAVLAGFTRIWRDLRREIDNPAADSAEQLAIVAGVWLALAGCAGAADAFTQRERILRLWGDLPACQNEEMKNFECEGDYQCRGQRCVAGRCTERPVPPKPAICQDGSSAINVRSMRSCQFCRDLTRPRVRRAAGWFSAATAAAGLVLAIAIARRLRRRARWIAAVSEGSPGAVVSGRPGGDPAAGTKEARRGERSIVGLLRAFAIGFAIAIIPMTSLTYMNLRAYVRGVMNVF